METEAKLNPVEVLQQLKIGAKSARTVASLEVINLVCKEQHERGSADFSYEMVGRLSNDKGGPKAQPIRNASGAVYRTLIDAWAKYAERNKPRNVQRHGTGLADDVLALINDPVARVLVQSYLSENKKLRNENQVLKVAAKEKVVIDFSGARHDARTSEAVVPAEILLEQERAALRSAISSETMLKQGWTVNQATGSVHRGPLTVFRPGFVTAIVKILGICTG